MGGAGGSLRVGLGVNSGTVVVGTIGGGGRLDFTVIGDAVNTAARVESATRQTGDDVLITSETRHRLSAAHATWDERPPIPLKGKRNAVELYAVPGGRLLRRITHGAPVSAVAFAQTGHDLVSGAVDGDKGVLSMWDVQQGALVRRLEGHSGSIWGIDWSLEQDILVSAGSDGTIRWWNPEQGVNLATVQAHDAWARAVRVSPDGKTVASCGEDGVIKLWDMQSHQYLATLRADRPYERLDISKTSGLTNAQQAALRVLGASSADKERA